MKKEEEAAQAEPQEQEGKVEPTTKEKPFLETNYHNTYNYLH